MVALTLVIFFIRLGRQMISQIFICQMSELFKILFNENSLKLNFDKSSYFILNPMAADRKTSLQLDGGMLKYKSVQEYLGHSCESQESPEYHMGQFPQDGNFGHYILSI